MKSLESLRSWTPLLACAALVVPLAAVGQVAHVHQTNQYPELDRMHEEALAVAYTSNSFRADLKEAARRHAAVADQRPHDDARRFDCLETQAALLQAVGDVRGARRYLERAAVHAEETGDLFNAAMAYLNAAILAQDSDLTRAGDFARQARWLAHSPLMPQGQRDEILRRFGGAGLQP